MKKRVRVFLDHGVGINYDFESAVKAKEYASSVIKNGYVHETDKRVEYFPPHRIVVVRIDDL